MTKGPRSLSDRPNRIADAPGFYPCLLAAAGFAFCWRLWLSGGVVYSPFSDIVAYQLGAKSFFQKAFWSEGGWPLWNPGVNCGTPAQADPLAAYGFPLQWLYLFLPVERAVNWNVLLEIVGAGLAMFLLCRRFLKERASAFFCAAGYMLCWRCLIMIRAGWSAPLGMYALTPLLFWSLDRALETPDRRRICELAALCGLCMTQEFAQGLYYAALCGAVFAAFRSSRARPSARPRIAGALAAAGILGFLLAAPELLPRLEFASLSTRMNFDYAFFIHLAPTWRDLATVLEPGRNGGRVEVWENNFYFGLWLYPPVLYACWKKGKENLPLILSCAALVLLCFDGPLLRLIYAAVPGFKLFRLHSRILMVAQLALLILAGKGLDAALDDGGRDFAAFGAAWATVALAGLAAAAFWKSGTLALTSSWLLLAGFLLATSGRVRPAAFLALALLPLLDGAGGLGLMPVTAPLAEIFPEQTFYAPLKREALNGRVAALTRTAIPYGAAGVLGIDMADGYEPLNVKAFEDYFGVLQYGNADAIPRRPVVWTDLKSIARPDMLRALDVEFLAGNDDEDASLKKIGYKPAGVFENVPVFKFYTGMVPRTVRLWRDVRPLGPAYFASSLRPVASEAESLEAVASASSVRAANVLGLDRPAGALDFSGGEAKMTRRGDGRYAYALVSRGENFLILSQIWYPGWRARLDGREIPLYRTNHALLGCFIPPGPHALELEMTSPRLRLGLELCALGAALIAFLLLAPA